MILSKKPDPWSWCQLLSFMVCESSLLSPSLAESVVPSAEDYHRFNIPTLHPQFDVYGPTNLDDLEAIWKIVWTGEENLQEHILFARLYYSKGLGWWDGNIKRLVSEKGREMLIGPMPPALPLLEHAGLGVR